MNGNSSQVRAKSPIVLYGILSTLVLGLTLTVLVPEHPNLLVPTLILFCLSILSSVCVIIDHLSIQIQALLISSKNTKNDYPLYLGYFFVSFFIAYFLSSSNASIVEYTNIFMSLGAIVNSDTLISFIFTQFNIYAESVLFTGIPIALTFGIFYFKNWKTNSTNFVLLSILMSAFVAVAFHFYSHHISSGITNAIPAVIMFSMFTFLAVKDPKNSNILPSVFAHSGFNLGVLFAISLSIL